MGSCLLKPMHLFCFSHCKTRWTMSLDNASLQICLFETSNCMLTFTFYPWCKPKWSQDEFQQLVANFTGPWDDFMVQWCKQPPGM